MKKNNIWSWLVYVLGTLLFSLGVGLYLLGEYARSGFVRVDLYQLFLDAYANIGSGLIEAGITILIIDTLYQQREKYSQKLQLLRQIRGNENVAVLQALEELHTIGLLSKNSLKGGNLHGANLENAQLLAGLDLSQAVLSNARLIHANLHKTVMSSAILTNAWLNDAALISTNLIGASLIKAHLRGAILQGVKLQGAVLNGADLTDAKIEGAVFDSETILPNGKSWQPGSDLTIFTNPKHPNYWKPDNLS